MDARLSKVVARLLPIPTYVAVLLAGVLIPAAAFAQHEEASFELTLFSHETGEPLANAVVEVLGTELTGLTDRGGRLRIPGVPPGRQVMQIRLPGYATERLTVLFEPGASVQAEVDLLQQPITLPGIDVSVARRARALQSTGFYQRRQTGVGSFITREEIEQRHLTLVSDALRGVRGVRLAPSGNGYIPVTGRDGRTPFSSFVQSGCPMEIFIDGMSYQLRDINELPLAWIEAIEVYRGPGETPIQFNSTGQTCGVILIWTR